MSKPQEPKMINIKYGQGIILTCGNTSTTREWHKINVSDGKYIVNVNCERPDDILTQPQTIERALWEFDLNAFPNLRHMQTGTDIILPVLKDGTKKNPERMNVWRQRSADKDAIMGKWTPEKTAMFGLQVAEQTKDARVQFAEKYGYNDEMTILLKLDLLERDKAHARRTGQTDKEREIQSEIITLKGTIRDSLIKKGYTGPEYEYGGESKKSYGGKKKKSKKRTRKRKSKRKRKSRKRKSRK